jgi:hypothetical protein
MPKRKPETPPTLRDVEKAARELMASSEFVNSRFDALLARNSAANAAMIRDRVLLKAKVQEKFGHLLRGGSPGWLT